MVFEKYKFFGEPIQVKPAGYSFAILGRLQFYMTLDLDISFKRTAYVYLDVKGSIIAPFAIRFNSPFNLKNFLIGSLRNNALYQE